MTGPRDCVPLLEARGLYTMADWASSLPIRHGRTCRDLWDASPRGDWLLAYAEAAGADRRDMVRAAAACVRPALKFVRAGEDRPRLAVEAAERWADEPTEENRMRARKAADVAWAAAPVAPGVRAAAWAAASATATTVAASAWAAAWAAGSAAAAHGDAEGPESEAAAHRACADEVRRLVPFVNLAPVLAAP